MAIKYCLCGSKLEYDINPPKLCPKCGINFAEAFKIKHDENIKPQISISKKIIESEDDEYELVRVKKSNKINRKEFFSKTTAELEAEDFNDKDYDQEEAKASAQEIAASLSENDIIVNYGTDSIEKLGKFLPKSDNK